MAAVIIILMSEATPPMPGGATVTFTILFSQLGLPASNLAIILVPASILDFVGTASNVFPQQCVLAILAKNIE